MTGRRAGFCAGYDAPGYAHLGYGYGRRWGGGGGWGRRQGWRQGRQPLPAAPVEGDVTTSARQDDLARIEARQAEIERSLGDIRAELQRLLAAGERRADPTG
jgi:hypothetical protein